ARGPGDCAVARPDLPGAHREVHAVADRGDAADALRRRLEREIGRGKRPAPRAVRAPQLSPGSREEPELSGRDDVGRGDGAGAVATDERRRAAGGAVAAPDA